METKVVIIRHGESLGNAARRLLGHTDLGLSELGEKQAESTAKALCEERIDIIYSSDLIRAYNTALPHASMRGLEVNTSRKLREIYLGEWEGKSVEEVYNQYGDMYDKDWLGGYGTFRFPNGESTMEAGERFYAEVFEIASKNQGKTILIAAHGAVIRSFIAKVLEISPEDIVEKLPFPTNASYSVLYFNGAGFRCSSFSMDEHLIDVGITKYGS